MLARTKKVKMFISFDSNVENTEIPMRGACTELADLSPIVTKFTKANGRLPPRFLQHRECLRYEKPPGNKSKFKSDHYSKYNVLCFGIKTQFSIQEIGNGSRLQWIRL